MKFVDLTGQKFNKLYVLKKADNKKSRIFWLCRCDCGNTRTLPGNHLKNGHTKSCGCLRPNKSIKKTCKNCRTLFLIKENRLKENKGRGTFCCDNCYKQYQKTSGYRDGERNPAFKSGFYTKRARQEKKWKQNQGKHNKACRDYKGEFIKKNDYAFCEVCKSNINKAKRFEVHHIYYASRFPKHKELHNFKNLVHLCRECHDGFHGGRNKKEFERLEKERGLKTLFDL